MSKLTPTPAAILCIGLAAAVWPQTSNAEESCGEPLPILVDTDICAAVDDVAALAMVNAMHNRGEVKLLGIMVDTRGNAGAAAVDVVNTYYGNPDIPIGALHPTDASICEQYANDYASRLAERFPHDLSGGAAAPEAVTLYRKLLARQKNRSVVLLSLGGATNLAALLDSAPDAHSPLSGSDLVRTKVKTMVMMGGQYPKSDAPEFNFALDPAATRRAVHDWPTPIVFSGGETFVTIGKRVSTEAPVDSPVRATFEIGFGAGIDRELWDPLPVWYAVRGAGPDFTSVRCGFNRIGTDGSNACTPAPNAHQRYLRLSDPPTRIATLIEEMLVRSP